MQVMVLALLSPVMRSHRVTRWSLAERVWVKTGRKPVWGSGAASVSKQVSVQVLHPALAVLL
jgi:hypothetical protein